MFGLPRRWGPSGDTVFLLTVAALIALGIAAYVVLHVQKRKIKNQKVGVMSNGVEGAGQPVSGNPKA